jgi:hypothetical protein
MPKNLIVGGSLLHVQLYARCSVNIDLTTKKTVTENESNVIGQTYSSIQIGHCPGLRVITAQHGRFVSKSAEFYLKVTNWENEKERNCYNLPAPPTAFNGTAEFR